MKILRFKKWHKIVLGILIIIAVILFAVPRIARWYIVKNSPEIIGRRLTVNKIRFNYFTGTLNINDLKLYEADFKTIFFSFKRLKVNLNYLPLLKNEIFVKYIILDNPDVQVLQNGDIFNFSDLIKSDSLVVETDTVPAKPIKYIINNISINGGLVKYTDQDLNNTISMNRVDLNIPGFTWNSDSTRLGIDFRFTEGGRFYSDLALNVADSTYTVNLKLDSLNLNIIEPYVENSIFISDLSGYLSNDIVITGDMRSIMKLSIKGINRIFDFQLLDTLKRSVLSFDELAIDIDTLLLEKNRLKVNSIQMKKPYILFEMIDTTNNWLTMMKPSAETQADTLQEAPDTTGTQNEGSFAFSKIEIEGGKIQVSDKTLRYPFEYTISDILMASSPDKKIPGWIDVRMSAGLNGTGNLKGKMLK